MIPIIIIINIILLIFNLILAWVVYLCIVRIDILEENFESLKEWLKVLDIIDLDRITDVVRHWQETGEIGFDDEISNIEEESW